MVQTQRLSALASIWIATNMDEDNEESISFGGLYSDAGELSLVPQ